MRIALAYLVSISFASLGHGEAPLWRATLERAIQLRNAGSEEARALFLEALAQTREVPDGGLALAQVGNDLAVDHQAHGRHLEAEQLLRSTLLVYQHNPQAAPLDLAATMHNLAISCRALSRRDESEALHQKSLSIFERVGGPNHPKLALALSFLGFLYAEQGRLADADPLFLRAIRIGTAAAGPDNPDLIFSLSGLAMLKRLRGDSLGARKTVMRASRIAESAYGPDSIRVGAVLHQLAQLDFEIGQLKSAESLWRRSLEIIQKRRAPEHPDALNIMVQLGDIARLRGRYREAQALLTYAAAAADQPGGGPMLAVALHHLAVLYAKRGQHEIAEPIFLRSLAITDRDLGSRNIEWAICADNFARTLIALKRTDKAEEWTRSAIAAVEQSNATRHPFFLEILRDHARVLRKLGRKDQAKDISARIETMLASGAGRTSDYTVALSELRSGK
jgi:tetratricopeptide (TPR) repeat protein